MVFPRFHKPHMGFILIMVLLGTLAWGAAGCADMDQWEPPPQTQPTQPQQPDTEIEVPRTQARTEDSAILSIYEHLLEKADSYQAKEYLADFYSTCDNWNAEKELAKDGSITWHVMVDMTDVAEWQERPQWQQASWLILKDGKVIPSNRFQANALRIEADLQELSLQPQPVPTSGDNEEASR